MFGPYLALGAAIACAVAFGLGWHYGGKVVRADWAGEKVTQAAERAQAEWDIHQADRRADAEAARRRAAEAKSREVIVQEVLVHAKTLPDPPEWALDDRRVRNINAALAGGADPGGQAAAVPDAAAAAGRPAHDSRGLGGAVGLRLPGLPGGAPGAH